MGMGDGKKAGSDKTGRLVKKHGKLFHEILNLHLLPGSF
jgi:hypothetical protein